MAKQDTEQIEILDGVTFKVTIRYSPNADWGFRWGYTVTHIEPDSPAVWKRETGTTLEVNNNLTCRWSTVLRARRACRRHARVLLGKKQTVETFTYEAWREGKGDG